MNQTKNRIPLGFNFYPVDLRFEISDKWYEERLKVKEELTAKKVYAFLHSINVTSAKLKDFHVLKELASDFKKVIHELDKIAPPLDDIIVEQLPGEDKYKFNHYSYSLTFLERWAQLSPKLDPLITKDTEYIVKKPKIKIKLIHFYHFVGLTYQEIKNYYLMLVDAIASVITRADFVVDDSYLAKDWSYLSIRVFLKTSTPITKAVQSLKGCITPHLSLPHSEDSDAIISPFSESYSFKTHNYIMSFDDELTDSTAFDHLDTLEKFDSFSLFEILNSK